MKRLLLVLLFVPLVSFGQSDLEKYDSALFFINMIREYQQLIPLELDEKLNKLAKSRVDELAFKGFYIQSEDDTGEIYLYTDREKPYNNDYFLHASIGLSLPGDSDFTYDELTSKRFTNIGFAKAVASPENRDKGRVYTMIVMDSLY